MRQGLVSRQGRLGFCVVVLACIGLFAGGTARADYAITYIPGPASPVYEINSSGNPVNSGWFPDAHFPLMWGGANEPSYNISWWSNRRQGSSLDDTTASPGGTWIPGGAYGSGDYRGYWITSVFRPSDYESSLLGTSVNLTIYSTDNSSSSVVSHTIDANYLVGFAHTEDYNSSGGITNNSRTIYSFDNGLTWNKGPWGTAVLVAIDNHTTPGSPRYVSLDSGTLWTSNNLATGDGFTSTSAPSYNPSNFAFNNALFYNRYLGMWMVWYGKWGSTNTTAWSAVSSDLINWQWGTGNIGLAVTVPGSSTYAPGNYPTMIGSFAPGVTSGNYDIECGQMAWLYNNIGGLGGRAIHFIKGTQQDITWNGGSGSLSGIGGWSVTAGGTFTGFTDEQQSLTFSSGSGNVNNDLSSTSMRVRGIVFGSGAGSYDISGNTLEVEAYYYGSNWALTSIANLSANTQTIDANVDARSAALYVRAADAPLVLNGNIDMWGDGGIVVYGTYPTTLNGSIANSGYHDFTSGQAEYIADANEARLVKQDSSTLTLGGANTFAGHTDILGGVIQLNNGCALQNSVVTFNTSNALVLSGDTKLGGLNGIGNLNFGGANLTLGNDNPFDCYMARYSGSLSGAGSLTKSNGDTQRISASNSYTGGTMLTGGVLEVPGNVNTALGTGTVTFNGGSLRALGAIGLNNPVVVNSGGGGILCNGNTVTLSGTVSGTGSLTTDSTGALVLAGANTYSGGTTIENTVQVASSGGLGTGPFSLQGGTLQIANNINLGSQTIAITATGSAIDTGSYTLTSSGAINVATGQEFLKEGTGTFSWNGSGSGFNGDLIIDAGSVQYTGNGSVTLTNGNITLNGSQLALTPTGSGGSVIVNLAQTSGTGLQVNGSGNLYLNRGANNSLVVNIGGSFNPNALVMGSTSTFLITDAAGTADLGTSPGVTVLAYGTAATAAGSIFPPNVLATSGINGQADYVTYNTTNGFEAFTGYVAHSGTFSQTTGTTTEIANITGAATLSAASYAGSLRVTGTTTLSLNGKTYTMNGMSGSAGVILNAGTISGGTLAFGANRGLIYTSGTTPGATISSVISGSGGISIFGAPGSIINLSGSSTYTGGIIIDGATAAITGGGLGNTSGSCTVDGQGTLQLGYSATSSRSFIIGSGGGTLNIPSGDSITLSLPLTGTGDWHKAGTGTLQLNGNNTFSGDMYIDAGSVAFNGRTTYYGTSGAYHVASGASLIAWTWGTSTTTISNDLVVCGTGVGGGGAVQFSGGGTFSGGVSLTGDTLLVGGSASSASFTGAFYSPGYNLTMSAPTSGLPLIVYGTMGLGAGSLTVSGTGGLCLASGSDASFTGATTVSAGSVLTVGGTLEGNSGVTVDGTLNGGGNISTTGTLAVAAGGFILAGTGTTSEQLTVSGNLSLDPAAEYQSYVNGSGASSGGSGNAGYGQLVILGNGTLNGTLRLFRNDAYTPKAGDQLFVALRNGGSGNFNQVIVMDGGSPTTYSGAPGTAITMGGVTGTLTYNAQSSQALTSGGNDIVIQF